jgi:cell division protein FtsL
MKKITVKRKIYKLRMFVSFMFIASFFAVTIVKPIFIKMIQTNLTVQIQQYERSIAALGHENEALTIDIQQLSQYARIVAIARESGYERTHTNIITVGKKD